ncbi:MAG: competence protein F [Puniceicoccaceae bacterium 5H]|nr:MAG: competence protein F [Puniceicoccaceae bacterium 5H]
MFRRPSLRPFLDLLFPPTCALCAGVVEAGAYRYVCADCRAGWEFIEPPCCETCGYPYAGRVESPRSCPRCVDLQPVFERGRAIFRYTETGRRWVHELKYHGGLYLLEDIPLLLKRRLELRQLAAGAVLVPVPLYPRRERERGFNQSHELACAFAGAIPGAEVRLLLRRVRETPTQTDLTRAQRQENVRGAFELAPGAVVEPGRLHVVVDDVLTTGATVNACAKVLRRAGVERTRVLTLAHG